MFILKKPVTSTEDLRVIQTLDKVHATTRNEWEQGTPRTVTQQYQIMKYRNSGRAGVLCTSDSWITSVDAHGLPVETKLLAGKGTWDVPYTFDKNCTANRKASIDIQLADNESQHGRNYKYIILTLAPGVEYSFGTHYVSGDYGDVYIYIWDAADGSDITYNDDAGWYVNDVYCNAACSYTPSTKRVVIVGVSTYTSTRPSDEVVNLQISVAPPVSVLSDIRAVRPKCVGGS